MNRKVFYAAGLTTSWLMCSTWLLACGYGPTQPRDASQLENAVSTYASAMEEQDFTQRRKKFARAEQLFRQVIEGANDQSPVQNADLLINLGNAAIQCERIGPAIAAYRQALVLDPTNSKARQNLAYARSVLPEWIQPEVNTGFADSLFFWKDVFPPDAISLAAATCFAIAVLLFVVGILRQQNLVRNLAVLPFLVWIALLSSQFSSMGRPTSDLVIVSEAILYSADSENSPARVSRRLPSGAEVEILQDRERWFEIKIPGNVSGWILKSKATRVL